VVIEHILLGIIFLLGIEVWGSQDLSLGLEMSWGLTLISNVSGSWKIVVFLSCFGAAIERQHLESSRGYLQGWPI